MNIFVTDRCPIISAQSLPDKHVVKMPLEACQMLSIIYSPWYFNWGTLPKTDGTVYSTKKGIFKNHPCTQWAAADYNNLAWLIAHGKALCQEYTYRYGKIHGCSVALDQAEKIFLEKTGLSLDIYKDVGAFIKVMAEEFKNNNALDVFTAYKQYIMSKPWVKDNYIKRPERQMILKK